MAVNLEDIRKQLEREFQTRISPSDPIMLDLAAKRIEANILINQIQELLTQEQTEIHNGLLELLEKLRVQFDTWINAGSQHIEDSCKRSADQLEARLNAVMDSKLNRLETLSEQLHTMPFTYMVIGGFALLAIGFLTGLLAGRMFGH